LGESFDVGGDFFISLSRLISFERSTSKEKIGKKSQAKFKAEKTALEFEQKKTRAKAAGFSVGSDGKIFKFKTVNGRKVISGEAKTVAELQKQLASKARVKAEFERK